MHFFWRTSAFFRPSLYLYILLLTQVLHHFGRDEFSRGLDAVGFQKSTVRLQPTAKSFGTHTRCAGKLNLRSRFHKYNTLLSIALYIIFVKPSASLRYPFGRKRRRDDFLPRNRGHISTTEPHGTTQNQGYIYSVFPCSSVLVRGGCHFPCGASCSFVHFAEDKAIDGL